MRSQNSAAGITVLYGSFPQYPPSPTFVYLGFFLLSCCPAHVGLAGRSFQTFCQPASFVCCWSGLSVCSPAVSRPSLIEDRAETRESRHSLKFTQLVKEQSGTQPTFQPASECLRGTPFSSAPEPQGMLSMGHPKTHW